MEESDALRGALRMAQLLDAVKRTRSACEFYSTRNPREWLHLRQVAVLLHATLRLLEDIQLLHPADPTVPAGQNAANADELAVLGEDQYIYACEISISFGGSMFLPFEIDKVQQFHFDLFPLKKEIFFFLTHPTVGNAAIRSRKGGEIVTLLDNTMRLFANLRNSQPVDV